MERKDYTTTIQDLLKGIDSEFDIQDSAIHLTSSQAENALMLAAAREYISETFNDEVVCVMG